MQWSRQRVGEAADVIDQKFHFDNHPEFQGRVEEAARDIYHEMRRFERGELSVFEPPKIMGQDILLAHEQQVSELRTRIEQLEARPANSTEEFKDRLSVWHGNIVKLAVAEGVTSEVAARFASRFFVYQFGATGIESSPDPADAIISSISIGDIDRARSLVERGVLDLTVKAASPSEPAQPPASLCPEACPVSADLPAS